MRSTSNIWTRLFGVPSQNKRQRRRPRKSDRPRDFQRRRVYTWEQQNVLPHLSKLVSLQECRELVEQAYLWWEKPSKMDFDWKPPTVTDGRGRRHACGSREVIKLPRWSRSRPIVLHECAHGMSDDGHGPKFVAAYVSLLVHFTDLDKSELLESLTKSGVQIADRSMRCA